ncbi:MAG: DUF481 domain-containing protein [Alphaproteobacteria bacterium]|nr:DUF481 domain-containing protein [Alphaproteobacteria bacterium]
MLRNGDRLSGEVTGFKEGKLHFKTAYAGVLKGPVGEIAGLNTDKPVTLVYRSGSSGIGRLVYAQDRTIRLRGLKGGVSNALDMTLVSELHPGTEIPSGFKWSGRVNLGATGRSGNTDTRSFHIDASVEGRTKKHRVSLEVSLNKEFDKSKRTEDDFTALVQHDRLVGKQLYFYTNAKFERDEPQDLALRTTVGTGGGIQIIENETTNLSIEAGPAYSYEDFKVGDDRNFVAGRWAFDFDHYVWQTIAQFFHSHEGTVDFQNTGNFLIDTSTGVRFPLGNGFNLTTQADVEWDSKPGPGVSSTDKTYLMTVGYSW